MASFEPFWIASLALTPCFVGRVAVAALIAYPFSQREQVALARVLDQLERLLSKRRAVAHLALELFGTKKHEGLASLIRAMRSPQTQRLGPRPSGAMRRVR
jgi:hypothetical protein